MKTADLKNKHNHALTQWLKVGIFSLLMLAPLVASVSQWLYVICNKNAYQNYSGKNEVSETVEYPTNLNANQEYTIDKAADELLNNMPNTRVQILDCYSSRTDAANWINERKDTIYYIRFLVNEQNNTEAYFYDESNTQIDYWTFYIYTTVHLRFNCLADSTYANTNDTLYYYEYNDNAYLDNAFYYGVDKMCESDLFNWTQNTALYTGIKGMTDNLEIGTPAMAILITYWTILTIAYVIIDILITGFTWITHLIVRND